MRSSILLVSTKVHVYKYLENIVKHNIVSRRWTLWPQEWYTYTLKKSILKLWIFLLR